MKKLLKGCGFFVLIVLVAFIGLIVLVNIKSGNEEETTTTYNQQITQESTETEDENWESEFLKSYESTQTVQEEEVEKVSQPKIDLYKIHNLREYVEELSQRYDLEKMKEYLFSHKNIVKILSEVSPNSDMEIYTEQLEEINLLLSKWKSIGLLGMKIDPKNKNVRKLNEYLNQMVKIKDELVFTLRNYLNNINSKIKSKIYQSKTKKLLDKYKDIYNKFKDRYKYTLKQENEEDLLGLLK
ncbi:hypothetical protein SU69_05405 [Thermosipho melanesiensis]|uniref:Uncharacterized protein n=2 Tax=Thermosipho melanesiensis TaxID=46541 RepID=A6LLW7_THEM4|nr:hypothetical protein [Thermosipho melanesiensis]ABR30918.1 hypothetical protein Tmel_1058 [Thermosipho melanesiensis BI429]APT74868.1 hypothetical protein BW47_05655 [Thermosipho melanesiensis]OOC35963.1 hypothetical protein SU68_05465 [Thermosipho melanesiensis]OOC38102.1 hypothetical protein SU69_05405 [Thermosipho melanesiensis]OOC38232.1 hypothetical protein SU70_05415 [Thermosipho melanesiensis]